MHAGNITQQQHMTRLAFINPPPPPPVLQDVFFLVDGEVKLLTNATLNVEPALLQSKVRMGPPVRNRKGLGGRGSSLDHCRSGPHIAPPATPLPQQHGARRQRGAGLRSKIEVACVQAFDILCGTELRQDATHAYTAEAVGTASCCLSLRHPRARNANLMACEITRGHSIPLLMTTGGLHLI